MTLIIGARCKDGVLLAADKRCVNSSFEIKTDSEKVFRVGPVVFAGAGDEGVTNEIRLFVEDWFKEAEPKPTTLFDVLKGVRLVTDPIVDRYKGRNIEDFGYLIAGLEKLNSGPAKLYTIFSAGYWDINRFLCVGTGESYALPIAQLLFGDGSLPVTEMVKILPYIFNLVSSVNMSVGGGCDICMVKDSEGPGDISHRGEIPLKVMRVALLNAIGVES